ncbi:hypothetical protein ACFYRY_07165 [Streptomyces sp. NPDC005263]|uniref:hypothetical protein n=1 Tax=Streptomyces sp. NPDC005263 TaxID=3364711 RepID=UPI0036762349
MDREPTNSCRLRPGTKYIQDIRIRLTRRPGGSHVLDGVKNYSTGALFAHGGPDGPVEAERTSSQP